MIEGKSMRILCYVGFFLLIQGCAIWQPIGANKTDRLVTSQQNTEDAEIAHELFNIARTHQQKNELVEALNAYEKAVHLVPGYYDAYNNMGMIYFMMGEDELGIQLLKEAIRLAPTVSSFHNNLGYALLKQGRAREAIEVLERAIQLDPSNSHARSNLRSAYQQMGCRDEGVCGKWQEPK